MIKVKIQWSGFIRIKTTIFSAASITKYVTLETDHRIILPAVNLRQPQTTLKLFKCLQLLRIKQSTCRFESGANHSVTGGLMEIDRPLSNESNQLLLNIDALAASMTNELKGSSGLSEGCCIYRVPKRLRELNEKAYTPGIVSIGPLHHGKEELKAMEEHKRMYLQQFLELSQVNVDKFIRYISKNEIRLRNCYEENLEHMASETFVKMILIDATFIIMVMLKWCFPNLCEKNDRIFNKPWMIEDIRFDMILLENQLPFFILTELLNLSNVFFHQGIKDFCMIKLTCYSLRQICPFWVTDVCENYVGSSKVEHLVDFLRICQKPLGDQHQNHPPKVLDSLPLPGALQLHQAGVKFKYGSSTKLVDLKFEKGILEIPQLKLDDNSEILFRNLQAFEQCHCYSNDKYVSDYILMMSLLIKDSNDVELLVRKGVIENCLPSADALLNLFLNLDKENLICIRTFYFSGLFDELNKYRRRRYQKWKVALKQSYFHNPWAIISFTAAVALVIFNFIQALTAVMQV